MSIRRIRELIGKSRDVDLLWSDYCRVSRSPDASAFAAWLSANGHLDADQLKDVLTDREVTFTLDGVTRAAASGAPRHERLGLLGRGAMGEVHIAKDPDLNRNVAVKVMDPSLVRDAVLARRFLTEVQITAQLDHPGIVPVYGLDKQDDGSVGYSMRIIKGVTLEQYVEETRSFYEQGRVPDDDHGLASRLRVFCEVANSIDYAHSRGVIHRDLKPENIMVGKFGEVIVMDWGVARIIGSKDDPSANGRALDESVAPAATQIGMAVGTPAYMSPEQAAGKNKELDGRTDQYSLGLILFELVTLKRAIPGKTVYEVMVNATDGEREPAVHVYGEYVPRELKAIINRATSFDPARRYPTVDAMADDIRRYLRDEAVLAEPDNLVQRMQRWISRHRQLTMAIGVGLASLLFVGGASAVILGVGALEVNSYLAHLEQERLATALSAVGSRSHAIDERFAAYRGELVGLISATEQVLADPSPPEVRPYLAAEFKGAANQPPDLRYAAAYSVPASLDFADNAVAPTAAPEQTIGQLQQLNNLQPLMYKMLVRSAGDAVVASPIEAQRKLVLDEGAPLVWVYVATEAGILTGLPGTGDYPDGYDPRQQDWYRHGKSKKAITWETEQDESGQGLVVTASGPIMARDGTFLGLGAVDLKVRYVADAMLLPPDYPGAKAVLLDAEGLVMASSDLGVKERAPFPKAEVVAAIHQSPNGHLEAAGDLYIWNKLSVIGWTYLVYADRGTLIR
jgi:serine/threonine protein kinase